MGSRSLLARGAGSYISVPQVGDYYDRSEDGIKSELDLAVESIPSYIERCSHFFAIVPTVKHTELDTECDLGSWFGRGWVSIPT